MASLLKTDKIVSTAASASEITLPTPASPNGSGWYVGRNKIINGAMQIAQRGTSEAGVVGGVYSACDRWQSSISGGGTWTVSQDSESPDGFGKSLKMDCTTANASLGAAEYIGMRTVLEGQDLQSLKKGTAAAESITVSFWVYSNLTGTYALELFDVDNSRYNSVSYTIVSANTWEQKTLTFSGDTTGVFGDDNGGSLRVHFFLGAGSDRSGGTFTSNVWHTTAANRYPSSGVNLASSTSNVWYLTGVQMEIGSAATPYEYKTFGQELAACQRYFQIPYNWWAHSDASTATAFKMVHDFPVEMRAAPTLTAVGTPTVNKMNANAAGPNSIATPGTANKYGFQLSFTTMATGSGSAAATNTPYQGYGGLHASAEL